MTSSVLLMLWRWFLEPTYSTDNAKSKNTACEATSTARDPPERRLSLDFFSLLSELPPLGMLGDSLGVGVGRRMLIMVRHGLIVWSRGGMI